jgi:hypothetical protein
MIVVIEKNSLGISIIPSFMTKSLEKQGIEVTSLNIIKDLSDKHIENIPLNGKKISSISSINRNKLRVFTLLGISKTPAWEQKQKA